MASEAVTVGVDAVLPSACAGDAPNRLELTRAAATANKTMFLFMSISSRTALYDLDNTSRIEEDLDEAVYAGADAFPRFDSGKW